MTSDLLARLEAERQGHKAAAEHFEARARDALAASNYEAWEHWTHEADLCWRLNAWCVAEIDRLAAAGKEGRPCDPSTAAPR